MKLINFFKKKIKNQNKIIKLIKFIIKNENILNHYKLNFILCDNKYILYLNRKYLNHNYYTDIITFNYTDIKINKYIISDIYISISQLLKNSKYYNCSYFIEFIRVLIHGVLHLLGYNDNNNYERKFIIYKENFYIYYYENIL
ncbi:MAG: rRNA maturation RNase YbeY [Candidatus Shikimatogenerans sp. Ttur]|uniref:Endoribonuclease YbeY n=1 Tax=Candidatus Shikimatogenerans sp. Ttur TaxID=3158569 RepID=A0AAU7ZYS7_9FLAO